MWGGGGRADRRRPGGQKVPRMDGEEGLLLLGVPLTTPTVTVEDGAAVGAVPPRMLKYLSQLVLGLWSSRI